MTKKTDAVVRNMVQLILLVEKWLKKIEVYQEKNKEIKF